MHSISLGNTKFIFFFLKSKFQTCFKSEKLNSQDKDITFLLLNNRSHEVSLVIMNNIIYPIGAPIYIRRSSNHIKFVIRHRRLLFQLCPLQNIASPIPNT